ncbi:MAG: hypothetical protein AB7N80_13850 [Bdellovibrionales bacterium]
MEPRRSRQAKWTELPKDYVKQVINALRDSFADEVKSGKFIFEGRIYADEIIVRMGFLENGRLRQTNFEVSTDLKAGKDDTVKLIGICVDVGATMLEELFSSEDDKDFPRVWTVYEVEGRKVYLQFSSSNTELESEADKLLGASDDNLVKNADEGDDSDTLSGIKARLGIDDEDDEDLTDEDDDEDKEPIKH